MKLYINQKILTFTDKFYAYDENLNKKWQIREEIFSYGKKLRIFNNNNIEVAYIKQSVISFLPTYSIFINRKQIAKIVKEISFLSPQYNIIGPNWKINGDPFKHDYKIVENGTRKASISKKWLTFGDCYELDIDNPDDEIIALAIVIIIDCVKAQTK